MANYDVEKVHGRILNILLAIDKVCEEHNLRYYIWAGTMLGAIRHKGFIPWDDDLDIAMPRPDYDKLMEHAAEWMPQPYEVVAAETDENYPLPFAKIQDASTTLIERMHLKYLGGIYIDVFPIDAVPEEGFYRKLQFAKYEYWKRVLYLLHRDPYKHGKGPSSWIPLLCRKLYTLQGVQKKIRTLLRQYDYESATTVADYDDGQRGAMDKNILGKAKEYIFEGKSVKGVEQYDTYLKNKYGDYMTIPKDADKRQHNFHYLDLEQSYKNFDDNGI